MQCELLLVAAAAHQAHLCSSASVCCHAHTPIHAYLLASALAIAKCMLSTACACCVFHFAILQASRVTP
jgi:hypothetical protein